MLDPVEAEGFNEDKFKRFGRWARGETEEYNETGNKKGEILKWFASSLRRLLTCLQN